ncbi:hypothetical protein NT6N_13350 [Oceaniferula spumae]|uniref:Xylose isomerase-like TIM barrel domain-containing protein n=1 Tax=Oceaniferula spumae TaxID=2979115 RepID=A0AAT9FJW6_9BACT
MNRRNFTKISLAGALAIPARMASAADAEAPYKSLFAPHPRMLPTAPKDYMDQMQFAYDHGFRAWEDNRLSRQDRKIWDKVGEFCKDKKFTMGVSIITDGRGLDFSNPSKEEMAQIEADMKLGIELSKATGQIHMTYVPGGRNEMPRNEQIVRAADTVKRCCDLVEEHGIIFCQEPISHPMSNKDPLIKTFADGHLLCKTVNRKSCKLLADFFHEGELGYGDKLIENAEKVWDQVAYVQYGDSPGRKEPGTGKLDYTAVTKWLRKKGYQGVIGMEHKASGKGKEGLDALLASYRAIDA